MDNPKCKLCGERHSMRDPHIWPKEKKKPILVVDEDSKDVVNILKGMANGLPLGMANKEIGAPAASVSVANKAKPSKVAKTVPSTYKYRNREKRRQYMRDYMRALRAKQGGSE